METSSDVVVEARPESLDHANDVEQALLTAQKNLEFVNQIINKVENVVELDSFAEGDANSMTFPGQGQDVNVNLLFETPSKVVFPLELNSFLHEKLQDVCDSFQACIVENTSLKSHMMTVEKELFDLRKYKTEHEEIAKSDNDLLTLQVKVMELTKENKDMKVQSDRLKVKVKKLTRENEKLKKKSKEGDLEEMPKANESNCTIPSEVKSEMTMLTSTSTVDTNNEAPIGDVGEVTDFVPATHYDRLQHEVIQLTNKILVSRRHSQQLKLDLKLALRALAQEVGDGTTPQTVLNVVSAPTWRGRQQLILTLQKKLSDLKLNVAAQQQQTCEEVRPEVNQYSISASLLSIDRCAIPGSSTRQLAGIQQKDKNKLEQIDKLTQELQETKVELNKAYDDIKGLKARCQTLDYQAKSAKLLGDGLEFQVGEKTTEINRRVDEVCRLTKDLTSIQDRERRQREKNIADMKELNQTISREKNVVARLQKVVEEKQEQIKQLHSELADSKRCLEVATTTTSENPMSPQISVKETERIVALQSRCEKYCQMMEGLDKERIHLKNALKSASDHKNSKEQTMISLQQHLAKADVVLGEADKCLKEVIEMSKVCDQAFLLHVETTRNLIRDAKLGEMFAVNVATFDSRKKVEMQLHLSQKEVTFLSTELQKCLDERESDMIQFMEIADHLRNDFVRILRTTMPSLSGKI